MASTMTAPAGASTTQAMSQRVKDLAAGTPGKLRGLALISVIAALVFGVISYSAMSSRDEALGDAGSASAQLIRIQTIRTNLVEADSYATNAFLVGGLGDPNSRISYEDGIAGASDLIAVSAGNNADDAAVLGKANDALATYTGLIEAARANNRQGYPVGAAYLGQASKLLRSDILPQLETLVTANTARVDDAYDAAASSGSILWIVGGIALLALAGVTVALSKMTRRNLNLGIVVAGGAIAVVTLAGGISMGVAQSNANDVRDGSYAATTAILEARIAAFDAKSAESLTLIDRGSGTAEDPAVADLVAAANGNLSDAKEAGGSDTRPELDAWYQVHTQIRGIDSTDGKWEDAVALATDPDIPGNSNAAFAKFDNASSDALDKQAAEISDGLDSARTLIGPGALIAAIAAVLGALAAWRGISTRLREYR